MLIQIHVGDYYDAGHGKYETFVVDMTSTNITAFNANLKFNVALDAGQKIVGIRLKDILKSEDITDIDTRVYDKLAAHGYDRTMFNDSYGNSVFEEEYVDIALFLCKLGSPDLNFTPVDIPYIVLDGGYVFKSV